MSSGGGAIIWRQAQNVVLIAQDTESILCTGILLAIRNVVRVIILGEVNTGSAGLVEHLVVRTTSRNNMARVIVL